MEIVRKTIHLLSPSERKTLIGLCLLVMLTAVLEVMSVASILPFMTVISSHHLPGHGSPATDWLQSHLPPRSDQTLILYVGGLSLLIIIVSAVTSIAVRQAVLNYCYRRYHSLSSRLFNHYLHAPYAQFIQRTPSTLSESVLVDCEVVTSKVFLGLMVILSNGAITVGVMLTMLIIDPAMTALATGIIGGLYLLIYRVVRRRVFKLGHIRLSASDSHAKTVHEAFQGFKEVKVFGAEPYFLALYDKYSRLKTDATASAVSLSELPRKMIETVAIGGALGFLLFTAYWRGSTQDLVPLMTVYVFAALRLLPCVQQMFQQSVNVRFYAPSVAHIHDELYAPTSGAQYRQNAHHQVLTSPRISAQTPLLHLRQRLTLQDVCVAYAGPEPRWALSDVSLNIRAGSMVGVLGSTGAGKSTLIGVLLGLIPPTTGQIMVDSQALTQDNGDAWRRCLGYVPQHITLIDDTIAANIAFGIEQPNMDRVRQAAQIACIHDFICDRLPKGYDTVVGHDGVRLSGGERQRLGIARAFYADPDLLILDEATSHLDHETEMTVMRTIQAKQRHKTIIMVAHRLQTMSECEQLFMFEHGRLVQQGTPKDLLTESVTLRRSPDPDAPGTSLAGEDRD